MMRTLSPFCVSDAPGAGLCPPTGLLPSNNATTGAPAGTVHLHHPPALGSQAQLRGPSHVLHAHKHPQSPGRRAWRAWLHPRGSPPAPPCRCLLPGPPLLSHSAFVLLTLLYVTTTLPLAWPASGSSWEPQDPWSKEGRCMRGGPAEVYPRGKCTGPQVAFRSADEGHRHKLGLRLIY